MIKIVDIDKLFSDYISDYVYSSVGKVKPEDIENMMPVLYEKFGKTALKELDGCSPEEYYKKYSAKELVACLKTHIEKGVDVSDFLCEALSDARDGATELYNELSVAENEEFIMYALNMLAETDMTKFCKGILKFIEWDYGEGVKELATEILYPYANVVKDDMVARYSESSKEVKALFTEVLSHADKDDKVFDILIEQFVLHPDEIPLYAGYLGKFGDERALPFLMTAIESDKINYHDFEELRFAIECLGGTYDKERDFSKDKAYKKIISSKENIQ
ncbi:MAG: hypothetical protein E7369_00880 [Clostridiales bacterium]|nr:hypothetical protein [Clostridiales bacterium]